MSASIIDGKSIALKVKNEVKDEVAKLKQQGLTPGLAVILVGDNPASRVYVNSKKKDCEECGINSFEYALDASTSQERLLELIKELNNNPNVSGILVQMPLPKHLNEVEVINAISPLKDADAFHPVNVGKIMIGNYDFLPCTPAGIVSLIASTEVPVSGASCVIVGRSNIVGKPMAMLMLHQSATVTICHSKTKNLSEVCRNAEILIAAAGVPKLITREMVKEGAVVIDVGMNRLENGKLCGDVDFEAVKEIAGHITPVPGGVGPMTRAILMRNTLTAALNSYRL